ncbi:pollen-specific leucine-rich repeat extensin-like protein 4 [Lotus japonicus]|uniref:pollen-specific leucine-rich repeat extensin-like protein 4 n=1 Tax=Lotus japonicus TaxID=34305 RepID=UPI0025857ACF|nr:pollen-specific leucine-rich repeat extensin-like protein 4 [Lotus japonicus]
MLQTPKSTTPTSPIILPYTPQTSKPQAFETQALEIPTVEKSNSEPQPSNHLNQEPSDREILSPAPSVSFPTNVPFSSPSNKSEASRQFFQLARERVSELPEHFLTVPSPNRYSGPRPEPLEAPDFPIHAVPLSSVAPPRPPSPPPPNENSVSDQSPNPETEVSHPNPETNNSEPQTVQIGSSHGVSEATTSNHPSSPETHLSIVPYTQPRPNTLLDCINLFNHEASLRVLNVQGRTDLSEKPDLVAED